MATETAPAAQSARDRKVDAFVFDCVCHIFNFDAANALGPAGQLLTKFQQMERFIAAGLPVPPYWHSGMGREPDAAALGDYVLLKGAELGASQGEEIMLMRTRSALDSAATRGPSGRANWRSRP